MFEDIYKSANDAIDTKDAFARISKKIYAKKSVDNHRFYYALTTAAVCAAALLAVFFIPHDTATIPETAVRVVQNDTAKENKISDRIADDTASATDTTAEHKENIPDIVTKTAKTHESEKTEIAGNIPQTAPAEITAAQNEPPQNEEKIHEKPTEKQESISAPITVVMRVNNVMRNTRAARASGHGTDTGAAVPQTVSIAAEEQKEEHELSYEEYCKYIGCDVKNKITDFTDVSPEFFGIYKDDNGNVTADEYTFSFEKDNEYLTVTVTKDFTNVNEFLASDEYEKSIFGENNAVVTHSDDVYNAYFVKDDTSYAILLADSSEDELKNVILSLIM